MSRSKFLINMSGSLLRSPDKMQHLGKASSPVVEKTFQRKQCVRGARQSLKWGSLNLFLAVIMYTELSCGPALHLFEAFQPVTWYLECGLAVVFTANVLWYLLAYCGWNISLSWVEISTSQRKLMGVSEHEPGFRNPMPRPAVPFSESIHGPAYSPSSFTSSRGAYTGMSTPLTPPHLTASPFSTSFSPYSNNYSLISPLGATPSPTRNHSPLGGRTPSPSPSGSGTAHGASYLASGSFLGSSGLLDTSHGAYGSGLNASRSLTALGQPSPLSATNNLSPLFRDLDGSGLRVRRGPSVKSSPMRSDECIADQKALEQFLAEQQDKENRLQAASPEASPNNNSSFWNYNRSLTDYTPVLRKYTYQIACRSPQQAKAKDDDSAEPASYLAEEVWSIHNVHLNQVDKWIENLRKWLSSTILKTLLEEIDKVNDTLIRIGCEDMKIGEVGISTLKQVATTKSQHVPTLNSLVPFLEVCANQEYLVSRIHDLGSTGCMSEYKWNGGGTLKGKPWGEHLPTDAAILMHMLCCYLDARLPTHPKYPDGKTFTAQHFMKTPDKPDAAKKDHLLIYQSKVNAPHFKVLLEDDILNPPKGRNNLFHAILLFLQHIKVKKHGMLGRINIGLSGINILWVLE